MTTAKRAAFTDRYLKSLKPADPGKRTVHWDATRPSFGCRITDHGVISFFVMRRMPGKMQPVRVVLGRYPNIGLAQARKLAVVALGDLVSGLHPKARAQAAAQRQGNTFAALAERFLQRPAAAKLRTTGETKQIIDRHLVSRWGTRVVTEIKRSDVIAMLEDLDARSGPYMATKAFTLASAIYRFGITRELVEVNPCQLIRPSDFVGAMPPRQRVLTAAELALVWRATQGEIRERSGVESTYPVGPFVRLLLLTAVRRSEAAGMAWSEVDFDAALWVIPARRTKSGAPHEVPLSNSVLDLLGSLPRFPDNFVFSTNGGRSPIKGFGKIKRVIDARVAELAPPGLPDWRFHDLRRTARTNLASLGVSPFIAELVIGHQQKGVHRIYDVHRYQNEKREALERWANRLRDIVTPPPANLRRLRTVADA